MGVSNEYEQVTRFVKTSLHDTVVHAKDEGLNLTDVIFSIFENATHLMFIYPVDEKHDMAEREKIKKAHAEKTEGSLIDIVKTIRDYHQGKFK